MSANPARRAALISIGFGLENIDCPDLPNYFRLSDKEECRLTASSQMQVVQTEGRSAPRVREYQKLLLLYYLPRILRKQELEV